MQGSVGDGVRLGNSALNNSAYTWFSVARYVNRTAKRIFESYDSSKSFTTGFFNGKSGVAYHGSWVTNLTDLNGLNWFVWMDQGSRIRNNGMDVSRFKNSIKFPAMSINWGNTFATEASAWQVAEIILYDYVINVTHIRMVEKYLGSKYGIKSQILSKGMGFSFLALEFTGMWYIKF